MESSPGSHRKANFNRNALRGEENGLNSNWRVQGSPLELTQKRRHATKSSNQKITTGKLKNPHTKN